MNKNSNNNAGNKDKNINNNIKNICHGHAGCLQRVKTATDGQTQKHGPLSCYLLSLQHEEQLILLATEVQHCILFLFFCSPPETFPK